MERDVRGDLCVVATAGAENPAQTMLVFSSSQAQAALDARERAQAKRDQLLSELENDEKKLKKGKFLGLF
jgi:hypothetical protein